MTIQSVDRAVGALEVLAETGQATVGDIAAQLAVHKSTASRLLASLAAHGLVEQREGGGEYSLGFGLVRLASAVTSRLGFSQIAQRLCDRVAEDLGLTANVAVLDDVFAVNVSQTVGASLMAARHYVGLRTPGHATSSGKILLALHDEAAAPATSGNTVRTGATGSTMLERLAFEAHTARTIRDAGSLAEELRLVRTQDWAASNEEWEEHITAVAVPLRLPDQSVEAALTVTGPTHSLPPENFEATAARLRALAAASGRWA